ncbi:Gfo/Idh/MocA family oxidoreductase [Intrasporangium sp.]|uniref:Gfo/Idh/MocA family protein n=1 Tax=Intrasporangium sp. TaxID=1925024 RepID=UPI0033653B63
MRFGLVGTGPWATLTHGPGLAAAHGVELVGVWGRTREKAEGLSRTLGVTAYGDYDGLLSDVEAVAYAVPPDVQADLALVAARAGKHLLLDKPVAVDVDAARAVRDAAVDAGVASVVFFTDRFIDRSRTWFSHLANTGGWRGGWLRWFSSLQQADNPFGASSWRQERGALWDTGPHALSTLGAALGPVTSITAVGGEGDMVTLVLRHESGASSTVMLSLFAPPAAAGFELAVWGESGLLHMPPRTDESFIQPFATAAEDLVASAVGGEPHEVDLAFGTRIVELLADAQAQLDARPAG